MTAPSYENRPDALRPRRRRHRELRRPGRWSLLFCLFFCMLSLSFSCFLPRRCPALFPRAPRAACRAMRAAAERKGLQDDDGDEYPDLDEVACRCVGSSSGSRVASATHGMELNGIVSHRPSVWSGVTRVRRQVGPEQRALAAAGHGRRPPLRPRRPGRRQRRHPRPQRGA